MGAETETQYNEFPKLDQWFADIDDAFNRIKNSHKRKIIITHLWVDGFGWENTILIEEDFKLLEKLEGVFEVENIMIGIEKNGFNFRIVKTE